jgi:hypothetical protein
MRRMSHTLLVAAVASVVVLTAGCGSNDPPPAGDSTIKQADGTAPNHPSASGGPTSGSGLSNKLGK